VALGSAEENDFVFYAMSPDTSPRWIGAQDFESEGNWKWVTGEPFSTFTRWDAGEPNNDGGENCAEFFYWPNAWNDNQCGNPRPFFCEFLPIVAR
jgi:hypothetical protein